MVFTRQCADVSKLTCHMRINGVLLDQDCCLWWTVSASVSGDLPDHSWWQVTTGVTWGRLGLRTALGIALPAFVASRIMCLLSWSPPWSTTSVELRVSPSSPSTTRAPTQPLRVWSPPSRRGQLLVGQLEEALAERELLWHNILSGTEDAMRDPPSPSLRHARSITPDGERPLARKRLSIQALITACVDTGVHQGLLQMHWNEGFWGAHSRLLELGDGSHMDVAPQPASWSCAGARGVRVDSARRAAPDHVNRCLALLVSPDPKTQVPHATCCALGEATRGHNAVTALVHAAAQSCDCIAEGEVPGLIPGTDPTHFCPSATRTPPSTFRFALHTPSRPGLTAHKPGVKPNLLHPHRLERQQATSLRHADRSALSQ